MKVIFLISIFGFVSSAHFPEKWERCKVSPSLDDERNECIERSLHKILQDLAKDGEESLGMRRLEPFRIKQLSVGNTDTSRPIQLKIDFNDWDLHGLSKMKNIAINGKLSSTQDWSLNMKADIDNLLIVGRYKINGRILLFPITGEGNSTVNMVGLKISGNMKGQSHIKKEKEYLKLTSNVFKLDVKNVILNFKNLLASQDINDSLNLIINQNTDVIFKDMQPDIDKAIGQELDKYARNILEKIPYSELVIFE